MENCEYGSRLRAFSLLSKRLYIRLTGVAEACWGGRHVAARVVGRFRPSFGCRSESKTSTCSVGVIETSSLLQLVIVEVISRGCGMVAALCDSVTNGGAVDA